MTSPKLLAITSNLLQNFEIGMKILWHKRWANTVLHVILCEVMQLFTWAVLFRKET